MKPTDEQLEQQLATVVAENAGLKQALEYAINPDNQPEYHDLGMGCGVEDHGYQRNGYSACAYGWESAMERVYSEVIPEALPETPATDAYLAEVRAQGVEMFAANEREWANHWEKNGVNDGSVSRCVMVAQDAEKFAAQLRQGAKS